MPHY